MGVALLASCDQPETLIPAAKTGRLYPRGMRLRHACAATAAAVPTPAGVLRLGYLRLLTLAFLERGKEERLVDPALEDRYAHLHALRDDLTAVHARLSCQLGRRQV